MENYYVVNQHDYKVEDLVWILKDNGIWLCQVLNPNVINQAETYGRLTRDNDAIRETLDASCTFFDIPRHTVTTLDQTSLVKSLDFHPSIDTLLLVGTNAGEVSACEVGTRRKLASRSFHVWDLSMCSMILQVTLANGGAVSMNLVKWNLEGTAFGVAYSKHIVQIFFHDGSEQSKNHVEIDAHIGSVNDIAFFHLNNQPRLVTSGEDKTIKVWDPSNGTRLYSFEGHTAPVCSVSPHSKHNTNYVLSSSSEAIFWCIWLFDLISRLKMASLLNNDLTFFVLQFLDEEKHKETLHKLEKESGLYFNMKYFEEVITNGDFDEAEEYLKGFTTIDANQFSRKIVFDMRKQKYLEALDKGEKAKAVDILVKQLKSFVSLNEALFKDMTMLLTMDNFRENEHLLGHGDAQSARAALVMEMRKLIEENPLIRTSLVR